MLRIAVFSFAFLTSFLVAQDDPFPPIIDFRNYDRSQIPSYSEWDLGELSSKGFSPFNGALEMGPFFDHLSKTYHIDVAIETGSGRGSTSKFFALVFEDVHTIEINETEYHRTVATLKPFPNAKAYHGDSPKFLRNILPGYINKPVLFYLDAHWYADWPLLSELGAISLTHRDNCIIVIDDFKVPGRTDIGFDSYHGHECSYEYIKGQLDNVYSSYDYFYLVPSDVGCRAKFVAIPKHWKQQ